MSAGGDIASRRDKKISIFVPSRYSKGQPIPINVRDNQIRVVSGKLSELYGGATSEEIDRKATRIVGTFQHVREGRRDFVDEEVYRVWTAVSSRDLEDAAKREAVATEADRVRDELCQESILYELGDEVLFTDSATHDRQSVRFSGFGREAQEQYALMVWNRVTDAPGLGGVLRLAGWATQSLEWPAAAHPSMDLIAVSPDEGKRQRNAWCWRDDSSPSEADVRSLAEGDVLVKAEADQKLRVWLRTREGLAGPRDIPLATLDRPTTRLAIEFVIALLDGATDMSLAELLDAEGATARFYKEVSYQIDAMARSITPAAGAGGRAIAQRLIGRLLFLRFVEEKGWLPTDYMRACWENHTGNYYATVLLELFDLLNIPESERSPGSPGLEKIPYLNGGLFAVSVEEAGITIPDAAFNPEGKPGGILALLYRYQFTLDEAAARDEAVSVDPAMLGRVLESLTPDETRKKKGVHYTPAPIAAALATGGIIPALLRRMKARSFPLTEETLHRVREGDRRAIPVSAAKALQEELRSLKIVDPAVGSGSLLVACLEVLLEIATGCKRVCGGDLVKGSDDWAQAARGFVQACLYGVDISPEAIEVARLRFWLFLAVGEQTAAALPDLGFNLRVGNSLAPHDQEERLSCELARRDLATRNLELDEILEALNRLRDARINFSKAADSAAARKAAFLRLEAAERELNKALGWKPTGPDDAPAFVWSVHFSEVFQSPNRGFDVVIANPPYVRTSGLSQSDGELKQRYRSMKNKNVDLYYGFIERSILPPLATDGAEAAGGYLRGLAGRAGSIAFVMPSFAQTDSAENLRAVLAKGGHVERWVDFLDNQVFPTATNYVALLFATAENPDRKTFLAQVVDKAAFESITKDPQWMDRLRPVQVAYQPGGWKIRPQPKFKGPTRPLGEVLTVEVGIQTSRDKIYLLQFVGQAPDPACVVVRNGHKEEVVLERAAMFTCAKGSRDLQGNELKNNCLVLWMFHKDGSLLRAEEIERKFPRAWAYLCKNQRDLKTREKGKFNDDRWWRFRRPQGVRCAAVPKIIVPSMMEGPAAYYDRDGSVICTASGKGGGGGWVLTPKPGLDIDLAKIAEYLRSPKHKSWLEANAEPKKGGWWGVDGNLLERCPLPVSVLR